MSGKPNLNPLCPCGAGPPTSTLDSKSMVAAETPQRLGVADSIRHRGGKNGGGTPFVLCGWKRTEEDSGGLNTLPVHLFFDNLTSPRRSEPGAILQCAGGDCASRHPRRRLPEAWRVGLVLRPTLRPGQRSRTAALAVAAINYFSDTALK